MFLNNLLKIISYNFCLTELCNLGVNRIVSYGSYIKDNINKIQGLLITHIHEDHIGGLRRFLEKFNLPIYASEFTYEFLKHRKIIKDSTVHIPIKDNEVLSFCSFSVRPFSVEHSALKSFGFEIMSEEGNLVITGDFKLGNSKSDAIKNLNNLNLTKNPLALLIESTNSNVEGYSLHEEDLIDNFKKIIYDYKDKLLIIATFASNMERLKNLINISQSIGKDIFVVGKSMETAISFLIDKNYISNSKIKFIENEIKYIPNNALVLSTGCQGEEFAGIYRLIKYFKDTDIEKTVLFSSSIIPGNELKVNSLKISLLKNNFKYIDDSSSYHTSGHAKQEELKLIMKYLNPKYVIPVHGDYIQQLANKENALSVGITDDRIVLPENNSILKFKKDTVVVDVLTDSLEYITYNGVVKETFIRDKKALAKNGLIVYIINNRNIKFLSVGIPCNCKLNRISKMFAEKYLETNDCKRINKHAFKEACEEYLLKEMKNEYSIPLIKVIYYSLN